MFRQSLLCALLVFAASAAKAVMIGWNLPAVDDDILNSTVYVYASSAPVSAYSAGSGTWTDGGGKATFAGQLKDPSGPVTLKTNASDIAGFSQGLSVWANLGTLTSGTYYYLVFVANGDGNADPGGTYAIAGAQYVTDNNGTITSPGFFDVEADTTPVYLGDFANLSWIAANHKSAPEPTALALLAVGVAGLALRRKVA